VTEIVDDGENYKWREEYFSQIDALPWTELVKLDDDALREGGSWFSPEEARAILENEDLLRAMFARNDERLRRKYSGKLPEEIEEERDFDVSAEPVFFQELWKTDLSKLTPEELAWRRENKWDRGTLEQPNPLPDRADIDDDQDPEYFVTDEARSLWHRRIHARTREEFELAYADSINPRNIAYYLLSDIYDLDEQALKIKHGQEESEFSEVYETWGDMDERQHQERHILHEAYNARLRTINALTDEAAYASIAGIEIELADAKAAKAAERADRMARWEERKRQEAPAEPVQEADPMLAPNVETATSCPKSNSVRTLEQLTYCPGLVGEVMNWILSISRRPNRTMALGAALTVVGTLIGRYVSTPTDSGTHLYVLLKAPTGAGKDDPLSSVSDLLQSAWCCHLVGQEFMSETAVSNWLSRQPLSLCPMDEFGMFLGKVNSKRANAHEKNIIKFLCTAFGRSFKMMKSAEKAGKESEPIWWPALSILAATTPKSFFDALTAADLSNGFLNRWLGPVDIKGIPSDTRV
jgi:hypothetical protein